MTGSREWNGEYEYFPTNDIINLFYYFIESLFGCFDDWEICFCGCCCLPCLFGNNVEKIDNSNCFLMCCAYSVLGSCLLCWVPHFMKRGVLRQKYSLQEDPNCADCPATCCCGPCAICQEARFLEHPGTFT